MGCRNRLPRRRDLGDARVLVGALAVEQAEAGERHAVQDLEDGLALERAALVLAQVDAVVVLRRHPPAADGAFALLVVALHRDLGDDALADQLVRQLSVRAVRHVELAHALDAAAAVVLDVVRGHDPADDVREILGVLEVDLLVDRGHVTRRQLLRREVVAVLVGAGAAQDETELGVARVPGRVGRLRAQLAVLRELQLHRDRGVAARGERGRRLGPGRAPRPGGDEEQFPCVLALPPDVLGDVVVHLHAADLDLAEMLGEDLPDAVLAGIGAVTVGKDHGAVPAARPGGEGLHQGLDRLLGVAGPGRKVAPRRGLDLLVRPAGHEPLDEVERVFVVVRPELGHVGRIEVEHVGAEPPDGLHGVQVEGLALLAVVEHQAVELAHRTAERLDELGERRVGELRLLQARLRLQAGLAVHLRARELPEGALGLDGVPQRRQSQVLLVAGQLLDVGPDLVQPPQHGLGVVVA
ncbi:MAG: hypothetical protein DRM98_06470, partial [Thermoplasmata archaeon]